MPAKSVLLAILLSEFSYATVFAWKSLCPSRRTGIGFQKTVQNHESTFDLEHGLQNCAKRSETRQGAVGTWVLQLFLLVEYCRTLHYLSLSLSTYLPICLSIYLSTYLSVYLSIHLSIYLSIYLSAVPLQAAEGHKIFAVLYFLKIKCGLTLCVVFQKLQHVPCIVALYAALKCSIFKPYCTLCGSLSLSQRF